MMTLHTGGFFGVDSLAIKEASRVGIITKAHVPSGTKPCIIPNLKTPNYSYVAHTYEELNNIALYINEVREKIGRRPPKSAAVYRLIACHYYPVIYSQYLFAIGRLESDGNVRGGIGWSCQIAIDYNIPILLYDINTEHWYFYHYKTKAYFKTKTNNVRGFLKKIASQGVKDIAVVGDRVTTGLSRMQVCNIFKDTYNVENHDNKEGQEVFQGSEVSSTDI